MASELDSAARPGTADAVDRITAQWHRERPELDTEPMAVFGRIYRLARAMGDRIEQVYARFGIGRGEFDVLATLRRSGEPFSLSPTALAESLMLTTGGMTGRLDKLQKAGLVDRCPDPGDRRALKACLTDKGRAVVDEALAAGLVVQSEALGQLPPENRSALADHLRALLSTLE
ncbi:MarR family transcriptional regulator [Actinospica sp.]|jgi:DNA-binding MarR family transcriptional regulator|uniref:MarR family winged helix-turn-helix transcriptional regulator n=1 Tax=Actinospica sp. TaxID=1872142 RepID=UPI002BC55DAE|nr:MarR family transcriptional regulator [Actinospica sp.]HWG28223.1 MarR family transcriptional regulator [Actinospica sp.]